MLELSVYQCADLEDSPRVATVTSLFPEHLDWSGSEEAYYRDKLNLTMHGAGSVVYNAADARLTTELTELRSGLPLVAANHPDGFHVEQGTVMRGDQPLFPRSALTLLGRHNEGNLCVALASIEASGVDCVASRADLEQALAGYEQLDQRLTPLADPSGITFVDDTLSTTPQSAIYAIEAFAGRPLTLILGGEDRGVDYTLLRDYIEQNKITGTMIGIPDSGERILGTLQDLPGVTTIVAEDLVEAVTLSCEHTPAGGVVLLSPAAPSYGHFDNSVHRSRVFREAIEATRPV